MRERWVTEVMIAPWSWGVGADTTRHWYKCWWFGPIMVERYTSKV